MICSLRCQETKAFRNGHGSRRFGGIEEQARKRLRWLDAATSLAYLAAIRGNRLEALKGTGPASTLPRARRYSMASESSGGRT